MSELWLGGTVSLHPSGSRWWCWARGHLLAQGQDFHAHIVPSFCTRTVVLCPYHHDRFLSRAAESEALRWARKTQGSVLTVTRRSLLGSQTKGHGSVWSLGTVPEEGGLGGHELRPASCLQRHSYVPFLLLCESRANMGL